MKYVQFNRNDTLKTVNIGDTEKNGSKIKDIDRLFVDFLPDSYSTAADLINPPKRGHALIKVNSSYDARTGRNDDPLYIRIESESAHNANGGNQGNPPQQIIININADNLSAKNGKEQRPLFFYYDGPLESRDPQPVILNLTTNFKGALWMPDVPVVIHGNSKKFEGFIVAKEFRYISTSGTQIKYTNNGIAAYYYIDSQNNIQTAKATGNTALELYGNNVTAESKFNLDGASKFRTFEAETGVNFTYVFYDNNLTMDETPFHEYSDIENALIPLYDGSGRRVTKWDNVKLYDSDNSSTRSEIPRQLTDSSKIRTVRLDSDGNPSPIYDEAGNPVYFCEDYVRLTGTYEIFTLDRVADGTRDPKEFLLLADTTNVSEETNVSNTDDWK